MKTWRSWDVYYEFMRPTLTTVEEDIAFYAHKNNSKHKSIAHYASQTKLSETYYYGSINK